MPCIHLDFNVDHSNRHLKQLMHAELHTCFRFGSGWARSCPSEMFVGRVRLGWVCWILGQVRSRN